MKPHDVDLAGKLVDLVARQRQIKKDLETVETELKETRKSMLKNLLDTGNQCVQYGDRSIYITCKYIPKITDKVGLAAAMKANGLGELLVEQPIKNAMFHVLKDWLNSATAELDQEQVQLFDVRDAIPPAFREVLSITPQWTVGTRAASKIKRFGPIPGLESFEDDEPF